MVEYNGGEAPPLPGVTAERCTYEADRPVHLRLTLGPLRHGRDDPTCRFAADGVWRATRTPDGPATLRLRAQGAADPTGCSRQIDLWAWGPGAGWALERAPGLLGAADDDRALVTDHPLVSRLRRSLTGLRLGRSHAPDRGAHPHRAGAEGAGPRGGSVLPPPHAAPRRPRAGAGGPPAPAGPAAARRDGLLRPPPLGVERRRAETVRAVARRAGRLDGLAELSSAEAQRRMQAVPGVGAWTAGRVALGVLGDADAVVAATTTSPTRSPMRSRRPPRGRRRPHGRAARALPGPARPGVLRMVVLRRGPDPLAMDPAWRPGRLGVVFLRARRTRPGPAWLATPAPHRRALTSLARAGRRGRLRRRGRSPAGTLRP